MSYEKENTWYNYCVDYDPQPIQAVISEEYITSGKNQIHLDIYGKEAPLETSVIFIHGTAVYSRFYAEFLYRFYQHQYRIIALDLPGHGLSTGKRGHFNMDLFLSTLYDVTSHVIKRYGEKVLVMGSSLGGITAFYTVANDSRIKAGICHNAAILNEGAHKKIVKVSLKYRILKPLVPLLAKLFPTLRISVWSYLDVEKLFQTEEFRQKIDIVMNDPLLTDRYTLRAIATQMRAAPARPIEEIETPIMILNSDHDVLFSIEYMQEIYDRLKSSRNKRLEIIPNAAHLILHEQREECLSRITDWLNQTLE
ncbi:MAG: alpha/beta fold hydrolase [Candidatus Helarchaeota archaeon]